MATSQEGRGLPACLGGWCRKREHCQHYNATERSEPEERLCEPGADGELRAMFAPRIPSQERASIEADKRFAAWMARV